MVELTQKPATIKATCDVSLYESGQIHTQRAAIKKTNKQAMT